MNQEKIVQLLRNQVLGLQAMYGFGSRMQGQARPESDLGLAVLAAGLRIRSNFGTCRCA
ncbi:hypothetical protein [Desulfobulbus propionicus]